MGRGFDPDKELIMPTRRAAWTACGVAGIIVLAAGYWGGKSVSPDAVTPEVLAGTVRLVPDAGGSFAIRLDGRRGATSYAMSVSPTMWRDKYETGGAAPSPPA